MGPMIDFAALARVERLVDEAAMAGGRILVGGSSDRSRYLPTLVEDVPTYALLAREEIFGPVTLLESFEDEAHAVELANQGDGGIQAGLLTSSRGVVDRVAAALDFGTVVVGGTSDCRSDALPFGGTGQAGLGREGVQSAYTAMTETKSILVLPEPT